MEACAKKDCEVQYKSLKSDFYELNSYIISIESLGGIIAPIEVFYENGTCYCVESIENSETLDDYLARNEGKINWQQLKKSISPLISAIRKMHSDGYYHRGISPENIIVKGEEFLLTGFDIPPARTNGSEIDCSLYFGFSAPEQYSSASWQGSWTDVYSLAAVCYRALTGVIPVEWRQRSHSKNLVFPSSLANTVPENVSNTLITALSIDIRNRYRTIEEFWIGLLHGVGDTTIVVNSPKMHGTVKHISNNIGESKQSKLILYTICAVSLITVTILSSVIITLLIKQKETNPIIDSPSSSVLEQSDTASGEEDSAASEKITIPSFITKSVEEIMMDKNYTSLYNFEIERAYSELYPVGNIVSQYPDPGTEYDENNNTVTLLISMGSERTTMPLVEGTPLDQAAALLTSLDIKFEVEELSDIDYKDGTVIKASVAFGETIMRTREVITVTVARNTPEAKTESELDRNGFYYGLKPPVVIDYSKNKE